MTKTAAIPAITYDCAICRTHHERSTDPICSTCGTPAAADAAKLVGPGWNAKRVWARKRYAEICGQRGLAEQMKLVW